MNQTYQGQAFQALGFDFWQGSAAQVRGFQTFTGITYPLALNAQGMGGLYGTTYDRNILVDQNGIIVYKGSGAASGDINTVYVLIGNLLNPTAIQHRDDPVAEYQLEQNYPNPFNPATTITFTLPGAGVASIRIFDVTGRLVRTLLDTPMNAGSHELLWNGRDDAGQPVGSGVYLYVLQTEDAREARRMILLR